LWGIQGQRSGLMNSMQAADVAPTASTSAAVTEARATAATVTARWNALRTVELPALNARLKAAEPAFADGYQRVRPSPGGE
jgi:hypothetical protein